MNESCLGAEIAEEKNKLQNTADKENDKNRVGTKLGSILPVTSRVMGSRLLTYLGPGVLIADNLLGW